MVDVLTEAQRSLNMSRIKSKDTKPEIMLRKFLHSAGYRYRLHRADLPGKPDLVFPSRKSVIFVNGCFWHSHSCKKGQVQPATRPMFWKAKRSATVERDERNTAALRGLGWQVLTVWECELAAGQFVAGVTTFLEGSSKH